MTWLISKYLITAFLVVFISEIAKRSDKLGGFIAAFPLVTLLTLVWLYLDKQPESKIANHAWYTFWYVIPTLPMFLLFPWMLTRYGFWLSLAASMLLTCVLFGAFAAVLKKFDIHLL